MFGGRLRSIRQSPKCGSDNDFNFFLFCRLSTPFPFCKKKKKKERKKALYRIHVLDMCNANNLCHQFHSQSLKIKNDNYNNKAQNGKPNLSQS